MVDFAQVLSRVSYPGALFVTGRGMGTGATHLRVEFEVADNTAPYNGLTPAPTSIQYGRWWRLSEHMTPGEIAQTALMAVLTFQEHETREQFKVDGVSVFDPHYDLDALVALRGSPGGGLKERLDVRQA